MKVNLGRYPNGNTERRISVEIDKFDTWGLDHTLSLIILPALLQLKHTKHGVPSKFVEDIADDWNSQSCFDFVNDDKDDIFNEKCKLWDEVLDKMIWSFQQLSINDDYDSLYHHGEMDIGWEKTQKQYPNPLTGKMEYMYEMVDKNPSEHWYDHVGHDLHNERIQEGLELFGKYFRDLWD